MIKTSIVAGQHTVEVIECMAVPGADHTFTVRHCQYCAGGYCDAAYQADRLNHRYADKER